MAEEIEMTDTKANKDTGKCPTCRKPLTKVGHAGKFRCCNPECPVVFMRRDEYWKSEFRSRSRWRL